jgi:acyl carrier protein
MGATIAGRSSPTICGRHSRRPAEATVWRLVLAAWLTTFLTLGAAAAADQAPDRPRDRGLVPASRLDPAAVPALEQVIDAVKVIVAERLGAPLRDLTPETDLVRDLYADPMDVFEVVAVACADYGIDVPETELLTTIAAISGHI